MSDFREGGVVLWPSLLPPENQLNGTMYVKVLCKLQIPGVFMCLCMCPLHLQNSEQKG